MLEHFVTAPLGRRPRLWSVGTALPQWSYTQEEVAQLLRIPEGAGRRLFRTSGIESRHLYLQPTADGCVPDEDQAQLLKRHRCGALDLGRQAIDRVLAPLGLRPQDVDFLCCVNSTGFMLPGLSAMYIRHLGFRQDCQRVDVVGMGCNAALNGLNTASSWAAANAGCRALVVCCEINSAIHVQDDDVVTALTNCLFGDGCAAVLLSTEADGPEILGFSSHLLPDVWRAISYHWSPQHGKFALFLDKDIPRVLGRHSAEPVTALLERFNLQRQDIAHWLIHGGGLKVIGAVSAANGLSKWDARHAESVLRRAGNLGSATVLFSLSELLAEATVRENDYGVLITMGPGVTIETALIRWSRTETNRSD